MCDCYTANDSYAARVMASDFHRLQQLLRLGNGIVEVGGPVSQGAGGCKVKNSLQRVVV